MLGREGEEAELLRALQAEPPPLVINTDLGLPFLLSRTQKKEITSRRW